MARGRGRRGPQVTANDTLPDLGDLGLDDPQVDGRPSISEDWRRDQGMVSPLPRTFRGRPAVVAPAPVVKTVKGSRSRSRAFNQLAFSVPREVQICAKRKQRREVLLAKGKGGRNRAGKRGQWSHIHCRRK